MMSYYTAKQELEQQLIRELGEEKFSLKKVLKMIELSSLLSE